MIQHPINILLATAYLPPLEYFYQLNKNKEVFIDIHENYIKQTYRNRCYIAAANGKLCLSTPVIKTCGNHTRVKDIEIDYRQQWQQIHWRSIESAYNSSPFFLYYRDTIGSFYNKKYKFLIDLNTEMLLALIKLCGIACEIRLTENYIGSSNELNDHRTRITPKNKLNIFSALPEYKQVFGEKHAFIPNLSIIDLLFNEGNYSKEYLAKIEQDVPSQPDSE
jgi:hypothetical protein